MYGKNRSFMVEDVNNSRNPPVLFQNSTDQVSNEPIEHDMKSELKSIDLPVTREATKSPKFKIDLPVSGNFDIGPI